MSSTTHVSVDSGETTVAQPHAPSAEPRVGILSGDRLCTQCDFNLSGQPIVRESHYGLLIARCPECGTPAALQEYPLLGRWVARLKFVLAAAWLAILLAFVGFNTLILSALTIATTENLCGKYGALLHDRCAEHLAANSPPNPSVVQANPWGGYNQWSPVWWESADHAALFAEAGGWARGVDWDALVTLAFTASLAFGLSVAWAVALPHARGFKRLLPLALVIGVVVCVLVAHDYDAPSASRRVVWMAAEHAAYEQLHWPLHLISLLIWAGAGAAGLWGGRAIARWIILAFLPPRLRGPWAFLWIADGKPLPR